jgi:hypothetical protein
VAFRSFRGYEGRSLVIMSSVVQDLAGRLFRQRQEPPKALEEYRAKQKATRDLTAKLRAERLAYL